MIKFYRKIVDYIKYKIKLRKLRKKDPFVY